MRSATRLSLDARDGAGDIAIVVERLLEEAQRIAMEDPDVHWQSLRSLDAAVRQQVIHMTNLKVRIRHAPVRFHSADAIDSAE